MFLLRNKKINFYYDIYLSDLLFRLTTFYQRNGLPMPLQLSSMLGPADLNFPGNYSGIILLKWSISNKSLLHVEIIC